MLTTGCPQSPNCDFEDANYPFCSWMNVENSLLDDDFDWEIFSSTHVSQFGQISDQTTQTPNGHFAFATGKINNKFGRLISENFPATSLIGYCMSFYYYFYDCK